MGSKPAADRSSRRYRKVIVQIPCFNEQDTLPQTVADIPRRIDGIGAVEVLVVDDGSTDRTVAVARACGVDHIVRHCSNRGLARSFRTGIDACLRLGADIIVNTDGDNQYAGADIPVLIRPILDGDADLVIGDRQTDSLEQISATKRRLQGLGSFAVRKLSGTHVPDAVSGFRAMSREAALQLNVVSSFSYTIETIIQAGKKHLAVRSVPIHTNRRTRPSRLFRTIPQFVERSLTTMIRMYAMYQPLRFFLYLGLALIGIGMLPILRFLYHYAMAGSAGFVQSLILGSVLIIMGLIVAVAGLVADLVSFNRQLIEMTLEKVRRIELTVQSRIAAPSAVDPPDHPAGFACIEATRRGPPFSETAPR